MGSNTDGIEVRSVGNSATLQETFLVEAFNLKVSTEYDSSCVIIIVIIIIIIIVNNGIWRPSDDDA